jgi:pimeloyl-ACP methyl ester carboxylesterase
VKIAPSGRFVEVGGTKLHFLIEGQGNPAVVLEAGIAATSLSWCLVRPLVAKFTTVVSYDRAGFGWSDPPHHGCTARDAARDLAGLLDGCGVDAPVVLVGHSFGGLVARIFGQRDPERVAGMVLVDPVVRSEWRESSGARRRMLSRGALLSRRGAWLAKAGVVRFALGMLTSGATGIPKLLARVSAGRGAGLTERLTGEVRKMPKELWPVVAAQWSRSQGFLTIANYLEQLPLSVTQLDEERSCGDLPLVVLSAATASREALEEHRHDAALSRRGRHQVIPDAGHWMPLDAPEAVADAIREVVTGAGKTCPRN